MSSHIGGDKRDRTADLLNAIQALSQLSYTPIFDFLIPLLNFLNNFTSFQHVAKLIIEQN